ncbi:MAG: pilus assembly protein PilM [Sedimentisphaerales bacterium]|nr:pilus assembly protein PilM [Sedimentisphaerales bacterium]
MDLGASSLKMVQLTEDGEGLGLIAAARAEVPCEVCHNPSSLQEWYVQTVRDILSNKPFKANRVVTCLPAREILVQHLRVAKMDDNQLEKALPWEAQGKVPFDIHRARLRHIVAGEVYDGSDSKLEVILMAASDSVVRQHLSFIERTKIQIERINVEPCALSSCFANLLKQSPEASGGTMFLDLGHSCTKVMIMHGTQMVFYRTVGIAAEHMIRALCERMHIPYAEAAGRLWEMKISAGERAAPPAATRADDGEADQRPGEAKARPAGAATSVINAPPPDDECAVDAAAAVSAVLRNLCEEIRSCVRYHDLMFDTQCVEKVIFVGGQAKNTDLCQTIARRLGLPAQLGDPISRIKAESRFGKHSDLETTGRHCEWAVAFGLSLSGNPSR